MKIRKMILAAALLAIPLVGSATKAQAAYGEDYCREYTKTVTIGGRSEQAYGTACYKPDGSWEIVSLEGSDYGRTQVRDVMYDDLRRNYNPNRYQKVVIVERKRAPYYTHSHTRYRNATLGGFPLIFNFGIGSHNDHHDNRYKKVKYKYDRHDNHHDRGRRGHR